METTTCTWIVIILFFIPEFCSTTHYKFQENKVPCHPFHIHISYGDTTSDITVVWATLENCNSTLLYGTDPWGYQNTVTAEMIHFDKPTLTGLQCVYRAQLKSLEPSTTYFYRPTSGDISSGPHFFKTPSANPTAEFLICGDHGVESDSMPYLDTEIMSGHYDAVLHVGEFTKDMKNKDKQDSDVKNATDETTEVCYPRSGDVFMNLISNIASRVPYMTTPGDHVVGDLFSHYRHWFSMPGSAWPMSLDKMWYSIDIGPVHFISYSTEVFFLENQQYVSEQNKWLITDLTKVNINRTAHPWIIAFGHRAMYCSHSDGEDCNKQDSKVRQGLEDLLFTYGVDLIIQAHGPSYERLYPQYKGNVLGTNYNNPKAPVQIITGTTTKAGEFKQETETNTPKWSAVRLGEKSLNSFTRLKVYNNTHLSWELISAKTKTVLDSIWITQNSHGHFFQPPVIVTESHKPVVSKGGSNTDTVKKGTTTTPSLQHDNDGKDSQTSSSVDEFFDQTSNKVMLGVGIGVITLVLLISVIIIVKRKQRIRSYRRWDATVDYGRKFYSAYSQVGKDDKEGSDFEVDSTEGNPSSKLLSDNQHK